MSEEEDGVLVIMLHLFWRADFVVFVPSTPNQLIVITTYDTIHLISQPSLITLV
jgi:hypothetical protein